MLKLSSQQTCQNSVIKILLAVGQGFGERAPVPAPGVAVSQSRCPPGLPSPPAFPEQQAFLAARTVSLALLEGVVCSRWLPLMRPWPPDLCTPTARGFRLPALLAGGFGGRHCTLPWGREGRQDPVTRGLLWGGPLQGGWREHKQGERGEDGGGGQSGVGELLGGSVGGPRGHPAAALAPRSRGPPSAGEHGDRKAILFLPPSNQASPRRDYGNNAVFLGLSAALAEGAGRAVIDSRAGLQSAGTCVEPGGHGRLSWKTDTEGYRCQRSHTWER